MAGKPPVKPELIARPLKQPMTDVCLAIDRLIDEKLVANKGFGYVPKGPKPQLVEIFPDYNRTGYQFFMMTE